MSNLSSDEIVARIEIYEGESHWQEKHVDRITYVFDHVTHVGLAKSRTRPHALEICERGIPVLLMSGATEIESYSWILTLQLIFTPGEIQQVKGRTLLITVITRNQSPFCLYCLFSAVGLCLYVCPIFCFCVSHR